MRADDLADAVRTVFGRDVSVRVERSDQIAFVRVAAGNRSLEMGFSEIALEDSADPIWFIVSSLAKEWEAVQ